ncbi:MAG TPA: hypothetical protein VF066_08770, partial [Thermoleophilaceae bacterium]
GQIHGRHSARAKAVDDPVSASQTGGSRPDFHNALIPTPSLAKRGIPQAPAAVRMGGIAGAALAGLTYLATRIYLQRHVGSHGTGLLQYDSYYPLAFARELKREGSWLLFQNPFGSLDSAPGLFNGPAILARATYPLWNGHLLAYDLVVGTLLSILAGWWFGRLAFRLSRQDAEITLVVVAFVIVGGGADYLFTTLTDGLGGLTAPLIWASQWGVPWSANNLSSWEILYHAIFWGGLYAIVCGSRRGGVAAAIALAVLHPFTLVIYGLAAGAFAVHGRLAPDASTPPQRAAALASLVVAVIGAAAWGLIAPAVSNDGAFFRDVYDRGFVIGAKELALFLLPAALLVATFFANRDRETGLRSSAAPWLVASALPLVVIGFAYRYLPFIPQPAHWTRVYPLAFLALAALAVPTAGRRSATAAVAMGLLVVGMLDSAIANFDMGGDARLGAAPVALSPDSARLIDKLDGLPTRKVVYVRSCGRAAAGPELEYSIAALTDQKPPFGHVYFSPRLSARVAATRDCGTRPRVPLDAYVVIDASAVSAWPERKRRWRFGHFVLLDALTSAAT